MSKVTKLHQEPQKMTGEMVIDTLAQNKADIEAITVIYSDKGSDSVYLAGNVTNEQFVDMYRQLFGRDYL